MANEIRSSVNVQVTNGTFKDSFTVNQSYTQLAQGANGGIFATSTSPTTLPLGSLTTVGWLMVRNLDSTNNIKIGGFASAAFVPFAILLPGEWGQIRIDPAATIKVESSASTPLLQFFWLQA